MNNRRRCRFWCHRALYPLGAVRVTFFLVFPILVVTGGCGMEEAAEYGMAWDATVKVGSSTLWIYDRKAANRMLVTPNIGSAASQCCSDSVFIAAAEQYLEDVGKSCEITHTFMKTRPLFQIEYDCISQHLLDR